MQYVTLLVQGGWCKSSRSERSSALAHLAVCAQWHAASHRLPKSMPTALSIEALMYTPSLAAAASPSVALAMGAPVNDPMT